MVDVGSIKPVVKLILVPRINPFTCLLLVLIITLLCVISFMGSNYRNQFHTSIQETFCLCFLKTSTNYLLLLLVCSVKSCQQIAILGNNYRVFLNQHTVEITSPTTTRHLESQFYLDLDFTVLTEVPLCNVVSGVTGFRDAAKHVGAVNVM